MKLFAAVLSVFAVFSAASLVSAQTVVYETYSPVIAAPVVAPSPVVVQSPVVVEAWRPVVTNYGYNPPVSSPSFTDYTANYGNYAAAVTSYYAPAATYAPVTAYSPVVSQAVTTYSPVVTSYSPVVTSTYSPVATSYYAPLVVRPRYVPGQPVRNFFRAARGW